MRKLIYGLSTVAFTASPATADVDLYKKGDQSLNVFFVVRADIHGGMDNKDGKPVLPNFEVHLTATLAKWLKLKYATDKDGADVQRMMEAIVQFEPDKRLNIWAGRILLPSSRANLSGILNMNTWFYPFVSRFPAVWYGRDTGAVVWGHLLDNKVKYHLAVSKGRHGLAVGNNPDKQYSARVSYNLWDSEPGYYNKNTYYGDRDILTIGLTYERQKNAAGHGTNISDFNGWSVDLMFEKKLANGGVPGLEGAVYNYDINGVADPRFKEGTAFYTTATYLWPTKLGIGRFQPHVRYMQFDRHNSGIHRSWDIGTNYIIKGHKARATLVYRTEKPATTTDWHSSAILGLQMIF